MKQLLVVASIAILLFSCQAKKPLAEGATPPAASTAEVSYAFGALMGNSLKPSAVTIDYKAFAAGMKDAMGTGKTKVSLEAASATVQAALAAASEKLAKDKLAAEAKYLADNGKKAGVVTTASGLQYEVLTKGSGPQPKATDIVKVDYVGTLVDGTTFDSSIAKGEPAIIPLEQVFPGWAEGLQLMSVGSKYRLTIPSALAYGPEGAGEAIGPNSTVIFEVSLLGIEKPAKK